MLEEEYYQMDKLEKTYWWHVGRKNIVERQLKNISKHIVNLKILNIGCGTGDTISILEKYGDVENIDVSKTAVSIAKNNGYKKVHLYDGINIPFEKKSFDIIIALDVLEHIKKL